jgi:hypothetical protein
MSLRPAMLNADSEVLAPAKLAQTLQKGGGVAALVLRAGRAEQRGAIPAARYAPGMGRTGMISTDSPGKIAKCGWFSNSFAAASCESARTTV